MADVLLRNVVKRYGNYEAVRGISLEIPDSKFVALVGRLAAARPRRCA